MEDIEYFTHVSNSPELINVSSDDQRNSILKICIEKYNQNKKQDDDEIFPILLKLADLGTYSEAEYYLNALSQNFKDLINNPNFANIKIKVGNEEFHAHSLILRTRSPYFRFELSKNRNQGNVILFDKPNITPELFKILISYIYDDEIVGQKNLVMENIFLIYQVELFEFAKLSALCKELYESNADIKIKVGNEEFYANSLILRTRSPYFRHELSKNCNQENVILFNKPNITSELYIYDGYIVLTGVKFSEIIFLLYGAREIQLKKLCDYIEDEIVGQKDLVMENISLIHQVELFEFAKLSALCKELYESNIVSTPALTITKQLTIQSNIIEQEHIELIAKWINEFSNLNQNTFYTFNLLQCASKHGSTSKDFRDSKGPTIVIMRIKNTGEILVDIIQFPGAIQLKKLKKKTFILRRHVISNRAKKKKTIHSDYRCVKN
ncbi:12753_t:CDS:2 [Gigaspora margarita]|uniref:12753_t:CDS:1 n=1 Tax=Gigaspora margarita TaxID=4874 RepID=A0ABN7UFJ3_GIGMA|nr:12753_t:CDS:2 [Gigaspora margarita]